jgi:hypothetical protein
MPLIYVVTTLKISGLNNVLGRDTSYAIHVSLFEFRQSQEIFSFPGSSILALASRLSMIGDKPVLSLYFFFRRTIMGTTALYFY